MKHPLFLIMALIVLCPGCGHVTELGKTLWGSSTRALEQARDQALSESFRCSPELCFAAVMDVTDQRPLDQPPEEGQPRYQAFIVDPQKRHVVVMGVPGSVDTTEVGIFFDRLEGGTTRLQISSLSSHARAQVAAQLFPYLAAKFERVEE